MTSPNNNTNHTHFEQMEKIWDKINEIDKDFAVAKSNICTLKGDIIEMKKDIKSIGDEITSGNSKLFISIITSGLIIISALVFDYFSR